MNIKNIWNHHPVSQTKKCLVYISRFGYIFWTLSVGNIHRTGRVSGYLLGPIFWKNNLLKPKPINPNVTAAIMMIPIYDGSNRTTYSVKFIGQSGSNEKQNSIVDDNDFGILTNIWPERNNIDTSCQKHSREIRIGSSNVCSYISATCAATCDLNHCTKRLSLSPSTLEILEISHMLQRILCLLLGCSIAWMDTG